MFKQKIIAEDKPQQVILLQPELRDSSTQRWLSAASSNAFFASSGAVPIVFVNSAPSKPSTTPSKEALRCSHFP
jgi:hypothetical protein